MNLKKPGIILYSMSNSSVSGKVATSEDGYHQLELCDSSNYFKILCDRYREYPIHNFILEFAGRFCSNIIDKKSNNIEIKLPEKNDEYLLMNWDEPGWTSRDYINFYRYLSSHDEIDIDKMSKTHEGFRKVLSCMMKRNGIAAEMIIHLIEQTRLPPDKFDKKVVLEPGWYRHDFFGEVDKWSNIHFHKLEKNEIPPKEKTYLKILLNEKTFSKIDKKKNKYTKVHIKRCFNKYPNVNIILNDEKLKWKPILPETLPENNDIYQYNFIKCMVKMCKATIQKGCFGNAQQHGQSTYLQIDDISFLGGLRNPEFIHTLQKKQSEKYYLNCQTPFGNEKQKKIGWKVLLKRKWDIYIGKGDARYYWIIPGKYLRNIKQENAKLEFKFSSSQAIANDPKNKGQGYDMVKEWHMPGRGSNFCMSEASIVGILPYTNGIMINTQPIRWSNTGTSTLCKDKWYLPGGNKANPNPKFEKCMPITEVNEFVYFSNKLSIYKNDIGLKNSTVFKDKWRDFIQALHITIGENHLYKVKDEWIPKLKKLNSLDDQKLYNDWHAKQNTIAAEKEARLKKKLEDANKENERLRLKEIEDKKEADKIEEQFKLKVIVEKKEADKKIEEAEKKVDAGKKKIETLQSTIEQKDETIQEQKEEVKELKKEVAAYQKMEIDNEVKSEVYERDFDGQLLGRCPCCSHILNPFMKSTKFSPTVGHIMPESKFLDPTTGKSKVNFMDNYLIICKSCNSSNNTKDMRVWIKRDYGEDKYNKIMNDNKEQFDRLDTKAREMGLI